MPLHRKFAPENRTTARLWAVAQVAGVAATVLLLAGLVLRPEPSLAVLWNVLIPLVPASLLVSPAIWRNVCPLATLNVLGNRQAGRRTLTRSMLAPAGLVGIVLLAVLVPARRVVFNTDGVALAATVAAVAVAGLVLGMFFELKAGFCNSICPVLPVERLYGQHPLWRVGNPRCAPCSACTSAGCIDIAPSRSIPQTLGNGRATRAWLRRGYGVFAASFPGFVAGYFLTQDGPAGSAGGVYLTVGAWSLGSYLATTLAVYVLDLSAPIATALLAAIAAGLYYWFASATVVAELGMPGAATVIIRVVALGLVLAWSWRALPRALRAGAA